VHQEALFSPRSKLEAQNPDSSAKRGFEKLVEVGFSREDIDSIRNNYYTQFPNNANLPMDKKMEAEEAFIDSDKCMIDSSES